MEPIDWEYFTFGDRICHKEQLTMGGEIHLESLL